MDCFVALAMTVAGRFALVLALILPAAAAPVSPPLTVFADSGLRAPLDAIAAAWAAGRGRTPVQITYGNSIALAKQIEAGAPADVFFSADLKGMDDLIREGFIESRTRNKFIADALVLIAPAESKTSLKMFTGFDLTGALGPGKLAVCAIATCASGPYVKQALQNLKVWVSTEPKLAQAEDPRAAVALVATGIAPFGITYATDAKAEPRVRVADTFPDSTHDPIIYPIAVTKSSKNPDAARFEAFTRSSEATRAFLAWGFTVLK